MIRDSINGLIAESMKAHTTDRTNTLRLIKAELLKAEKDNPSAYNEALEIKVLNKMVASHKDSIAQFAGRPDLIEQEQIELSIIQEFLPAEVDEVTIISATTDIIRDLIKEREISMKDMKYILSKVQEKYPTANGGIVSKTLKSFL